jgi:hypothetical protein
MATSDRWTDDIVCQCGVAVVIHWVDRAYLTSEPEIARVVGPAIKRKHKSGWLLDKGSRRRVVRPLRCRAVRERDRQEDRSRWSLHRSLTADDGHGESGGVDVRALR